VLTAEWLAPETLGHATRPEEVLEPAASAPWLSAAQEKKIASLETDREGDHPGADSSTLKT